MTKGLDIFGSEKPKLLGPPKKQKPTESEPNDPGIQDLLALIKGISDRGEYTTTVENAGLDLDPALLPGANLTVFSVNRRIEYAENQPRLFMDNNGPLVDWKDRFERPGHVFDHGERVFVPAIVGMDKRGFVLTADDQDGRMADKFSPMNVPEKLAESLKRFEGVAIGCIVRIKEQIHSEYQISDINKYKVTLEPNLTIPPINPKPQEVADLPKNTRVIIEGKVKGINVEETIGSYGIKSKTSRIKLETPDGDELEVPHLSDKLLFDSGVLENISSKPVLPHDTIRITAYVERPKGQEPILHCRMSDPFLVEPSRARAFDYDSLRKGVSVATSSFEKMLDKNDFVAARNAFAQLRTFDLTQEESDVVMKSIDRFPVNEVPFYFGETRRLSWTQRMDDAYHVHVESMTKDEFLSFARGVGTGRLLETGPHTDASEVFMLMTDAKYPEEVQLSILCDSVDSRLRRLIVAGDTHEEYWPESYMLENSLGYLSRLNHPDATKKILEVLRFAMKNQLYEKRQDRGDEYGVPRRFLHLLYAATNSLRDSVCDNPGNLQAIEDLGELLKWQEELRPYPFNQIDIQRLEEVTNHFRIS